MKSQVLHTVWCYISGEAAGGIWNWSRLGVKGLNSFSLMSLSCNLHSSKGNALWNHLFFVHLSTFHGTTSDVHAHEKRWRSWLSIIHSRNALEASNIKKCVCKSAVSRNVEEVVKINTTSCTGHNAWVGMGSCTHLNVFCCDWTDLESFSSRVCGRMSWST